MAECRDFRHQDNWSSNIHLTTTPGMTNVGMVGISSTKILNLPFPAAGFYRCPNPTFSISSITLSNFSLYFISKNDQLLVRQWVYSESGKGLSTR